MTTARLTRLWLEAKSSMSVHASLGLEPPAKKAARIRKENSPRYREGHADGHAALAKGIRALVHDPAAFAKWQRYGLSKPAGDEYSQGWNDGHTKASATAR